MGKLHFGQSILTTLQQANAYLHRLVGSKLYVQQQEVKENDYSLHLGDVVMVRFMNRGQTPVLIDNQILLYSGEVYVEGDTAGPGIDHAYKIEFQPINPDKTPLGAPQKPFLYTGNHLSIRVMVRRF